MFTLAGARILPLHWGYTSTKMFLLWEKSKIAHVGSKNLLFKISIYDISIFQEGDPGIPCGAYSVTGASMSRLQVDIFNIIIIIITLVVIIITICRVEDEWTQDFRRLSSPMCLTTDMHSGKLLHYQ